MLIFLVGQPHSLGPLTGTNKDQVFVSPFVGVPWRADSFAAERINPQLILTSFLNIPGVQPSANTRTFGVCGGLGGFIEYQKLPRPCSLFCKMWCACRRIERLDELGTLLAQMSAPQPDPALTIHADNFALLSGWRTQWLPWINLVTSVWVMRSQDGEVLFVHLCFLWKPFPITGD